MLPREAILEFQKIYEEYYKEKISFEDAEIQANRVFFSVKSSYHPVKKEWLHKLKGKEVNKKNMAKLTATSLVLPEPGRHLCTLISVREVENKFFTPGKDKDDKKNRLEWTFAYDKKPEMQVKKWSSFNLSSYKGKKSIALILTEALLGRVLSPEEREQADDTDELIGKKCYLTVKHEKNEAGEMSIKVIDVETATEEVPF